MAIASAWVVIGQLGTNQMTVQEASRASKQKRHRHTHHQSKNSVCVCLSVRAAPGEPNLTWRLRSEEFWLWAGPDGVGRRKGRRSRPQVMGEGVDEEPPPGSEEEAQRGTGPRKSWVV